MKKIIMLCLLVACCLLPFGVWAEELDTGRTGSIQLDYSQDGMGFAGLQIEIYRVAEAFADGTFALLEPFSGFPVSIHGITSQAEWRDVSQTLVAYIIADGVAPSFVGVTGQNGEVSFEALPLGLYLVRGARAEQNGETYVFHEFMIYLATPVADGGFDYDVTAKPKYTRYGTEDHYRVVKLWKDFGVEQRPEQVTVELYKDGQFFEAVQLNAENQWCYQWTDPDGAQWQVVERDVPEGYLVSVSANETVFSITNTNPDAPPPPPTTGDQFPALLWAMVLCLAGLAMILLALRGRQYEKNA